MARILVVDDNREIQDLYLEFLHRQNHQVVLASNGKEGLDKIRLFHPELIFLDMKMPEMNGLQLLLSLRRIDRKVPIIIVSGQTSMKNDMEIKLCSQVKDFLEKPIKLDVLKKRMEEVLAQNTPALQPTPVEKPQAEEVMEGKVLGGCQIEALLGEGGSGKVYKGRHLAGHFPVAIKILSPESTRDPSEIQRFMREGKLLSYVEHPNIVKIINTGYEAPYYFLNMQYIESDNLLDLIHANTVIPWPYAIDIVKQVARGLYAVHELHLVHRDIKPSNILIEKETRTAKIIDFGTVRGDREDEKVTQEGYIVGTPFYISPEQCLGDFVDHRSDIYSLGCTMYHMLTGNPPFRAETTVDTMFAHVRNPLVLPHIVNPQIPLDLSFVVDKMLQKKSSNRYQNVVELYQALEKVENRAPENLSFCEVSKR